MTTPVTAFPASSRTCPACGGDNAPDAVFCAGCDKALGEFAYAREEVIADTRWHEALAERATSFVGKPHFVVVHLAWFATWILLNTGLMMTVRHWDTYPFSLLGLLLAIEATFLSGFVLISQNRQNAFAERDARLDYEVNIRTYRELRETRARIDAALNQLDRIERTVNRKITDERQ